MPDIKVNDVLDGIVCDLASGGEGIIKADRYPIFVPFALEGEHVRAKVTYVKKDCAFGELIEVLTPSNDRVKPACPYFYKCGGCDLLHMTHEAGLDLKAKTVKTALKKIAGIDVDVPPVISPVQSEYRNKIALPFSVNKRSEIVKLGFFERRTHQVVPIKWCPMGGQWTASLISALSDWANEYKISVYDEQSGKGLLRHAVARYLDSLSLTLVINGDSLPHAEELEKRLKADFGDFCLYISKNTAKTNVIFGESASLICGEERPQNLGKFCAVVPPKAFLQVNNRVRDLIYDAAAAFLDGFEGEIVELYSGIGLLTCQLATRLENCRIVSVEIERSAVDSANALIKSLSLDGRVRAICDDALHFMQSLGEGKGKKALILDPPRRGCDRQVLTSAIRAGFDKILYISCDPQTLSRDIGVLKEAYRLESVRPYDMFPGTAQVECVAALCKI